MKESDNVSYSHWSQCIHAVLVFTSSVALQWFLSLPVRVVFHFPYTYLCCMCSYTCEYSTYYSVRNTHRWAMSNEHVTVSVCSHDQSEKASSFLITICISIEGTQQMRWSWEEIIYWNRYYGARMKNAFLKWQNNKRNQTKETAKKRKKNDFVIAEKEIWVCLFLRL